MRAHWLKGIGHAKGSLPEAWLAERPGILERTGFPRRPRIEPGDRLVYYAAGWRRVFAVVEAVDPRWMTTPTPYGPVPLVWGAVAGGAAATVTAAETCIR